MPPPAVLREFDGLPSPTAPRAGAVDHPCQGLYRRAAGTKPSVALIATRYRIDFFEHYLAEDAATRGIGLLGRNPGTRDERADVVANCISARW